jgi:hypothetical protein
LKGELTAVRVSYAVVVLIGLSLGRDVRYAVRYASKCGLAGGVGRENRRKCPYLGEVDEGIGYRSVIVGLALDVWVCDIGHRRETGEQGEMTDAQERRHPPVMLASDCSEVGGPCGRAEDVARNTAMRLMSRKLNIVKEWIGP